MDWKDLIQDIEGKGFQRASEKVGQYGIYPASLTEKDGAYFFITRVAGEKKLIVAGRAALREAFTGENREIGGKEVKIAPLDHGNAAELRRIFAFTRPAAFGKERASLGLGDRLGIASPGHIDAIRNKGVKPVLAQQSVRELDLTGRSFTDILDAASWAVFQEGYREGFGADGDHLKSKEDISKVLDLDFSMITLDCSEYIDNDIQGLDAAGIEEKYSELPAAERAELEGLYREKCFILDGGTEIEFSGPIFKEIVLTYREMLRFTREVFYELIKGREKAVDFEVSVDETATPTTPQAHYFVAAELIRAGVEFNSLAPRFCGEFQKGVDYIGDLEQFEKEFKIHALIADRFGYKISIHSGSDKFSVFPSIGKYTGGRVHVKTAGTNWLEAIRIIARYDPDLYREVHQFALDSFEEATKYYHVTTDIGNIPRLDSLTDQELPGMLEENDSRQLIHITYGLILQARKNGGYLFRDRLYQLWDQHEADYRRALEGHIGRHIKELGLPVDN